MTNIGFIGLGHMGLPMAINLIKAGFKVTGYDLLDENLARLVAAGGDAADSIKKASENQNVIITMLQKGEQVKEVCLKEDGIFATAHPETLYIDCSSIDVTTAREIHHEGNQRGLNVLDSPVSGGVAGASAATLTFMVGGDENNFKIAEPILKKMGKRIIHTGGPGNGQVAKICNNMVLGISMIAISESFKLGEKLGLPPKKLFEVMNHASGQCWALSHYVPIPGLIDNVPANTDYKPGFTAAMMLKDLKLSQTAAETCEIETQLGALATAIYQRFFDQGSGELDFSAIIKQIE